MHFQLIAKNWQQFLPMIIGPIMALFHWLGYPPFEMPIFSVIASLIFYYSISAPYSLKLKLIGTALYCATFFHLLHSQNEWLVMISSAGNQWYFNKFKWLAIFQYALGSFTFFSITIILWKLISGDRRGYLPAYLSFAVVTQFFFTTSNHNDAFFIPLLSSSWIKNLPVPFFLWVYLFYFFLFSSLYSLLRCNLKKVLLWFTLLLLVLLLTHLPTAPTEIPEVVIHPAESYNIDIKSSAEIEKHFSHFFNNHSKNQIILWPEALITFNQTQRNQQAIFEQILLDRYPGTHYFGAYTIKASEEGASSNQYVMLSSESGQRKTINKAYPVPFQESSDYFWLIPSKEIKLSFNTPTQYKFNTLSINDRPAAIYLCNEIFDTGRIWRSFPSDASLVLVPSNPPLQNLMYYEQLLDFYARILSRLTGVSSIKYTSKGKVSVHHAGRSTAVEAGSSSRVHIGRNGLPIIQY